MVAHDELRSVCLVIVFGPGAYPIVVGPGGSLQPSWQRTHFIREVEGLECILTRGVFNVGVKTVMYCSVV